VRRALAASRLVPGSAVSFRAIFDAIGEATGVPYSNVFKWYHKRDVLLARYLDTKSRKKESFGSGRHPLFPQAEAAAAKEARECREKHKIVTKSSFLTKLKAQAELENPEAAKKARFDLPYLRSVLRRNSLALRLPSCTKAMSLENGVSVCQGFFQWLHRYLKDELPGGKRAQAPLDPVYGRFPLDCRLNKDEVSSSVGFYTELYSRCLCPSGHRAGPLASPVSAPRTFRLPTAGRIASPLWLSRSPWMGNLFCLWCSSSRALGSASTRKRRPSTIHCPA